MDKATRARFDTLHSDDAKERYAAFQYLVKATKEKVDWAGEAWDDLVAMLRHKNNHARAIAAQLLASLAKSDTKNRMLRDLDALLTVTRDERFVTARHSLQSMWKVAAAGKKLQKVVVERLAERFEDCAAEKNCTLVRYDIIVVLKKLHDAVKDDGVKQKALELIETEQDLKYRRKYAGAWKRLEP